MKVLFENTLTETDEPALNAISLPQGIIGFADCQRAELNYATEQLPFLWMRLLGPARAVNFVVIEPGGVLPGYEIEIFDRDAEALDLHDATEAMVLNIVTLRPDAPTKATVNLIGPIVINRRTRIGRQIVIANHAKYSARHGLIDPAEMPVLISA